MKCLTGKYLETIFHKLLVFGESGSLKDLVTSIALIIKQGMTNVSYEP
jgi:hypothetical protein